MKNTGITREVDDMGRIVLPIELRRNLNIDEGTALEIYVDESGNIVLSPVVRALTPEELKERRNKPVFFVARENNRGDWKIIDRIFKSKNVYTVVTKGEWHYEFDAYYFYDKEV